MLVARLTQHFHDFIPDALKPAYCCSNMSKPIQVLELTTTRSLWIHMRFLECVGRVVGSSRTASRVCFLFQTPFVIVTNRRRGRIRLARHASLRLVQFLRHQYNSSTVIRPTIWASHIFLDATFIRAGRLSPRKFMLSGHTPPGIRARSRWVLKLDINKKASGGCVAPLKRVWSAPILITAANDRHIDHRRRSSA